MRLVLGGLSVLFTVFIEFSASIFDSLWVITDAKTKPRELNKFNWVGWGVDGEQAQITDVEGPLGFAHV